jgi:hypothetical protein
MASQILTGGVGAWTLYHELSAEDKTVFQDAMSGFVGVNYSPNQVATQLVNGTNYRFKCIASLPPAMVVWEAIVDIYQPLNGKLYLTGIHKI